MTRTGTLTDVPPATSFVTPVAADVAKRVANTAGRDADGLLLALLRTSGQVGLQVSSSLGQQWWLQMETAIVTGTPLAVVVDTSTPPLFALRAQIDAPVDGTGRAMALDQWIYWLARFSRGDDLYGYSDNHVLSVRRGVASATHGRDFARLMVAYGSPMTVPEAAERTRTDITSVRRFLNASTVLHRVRVHGSAPSTPPVVAPRVESLEATAPVTGTGPAAAPAMSAPPRGLFARLLDRLRGRP